MKRKLLKLVATLFCITAVFFAVGCGNIFTKPSGEEVKSTDEFYSQIRYCMERNIKSCSLVYKGFDVSKAVDIDNILNDVYGIKSVKYEILRTVYGNQIKLDLEYWDSDAIIYAYRNADSSFLTERQRTMYEEYLAILNLCTSDSKTDYENEKAVHDYLIEHITYDTDINSHFNAYEALTEGRAVCAGYAECFRTLMELLGIECATISGTANNENHIWNAVCLDDQWYQVDVTWDDVESNDSPNSVIIHTYFNVSEEDMAADHTRTSSLPKDYVGGIRYIYTNYENIPVIFDQKTLNAMISKSINSRKQGIEFIAKKDLNIKDAVGYAGVRCTYTITTVERNDSSMNTINCIYY